MLLSYLNKRKRFLVYIDLIHCMFRGANHFKTYEISWFSKGFLPKAYEISDFSLGYPDISKEWFTPSLYVRFASGLPLVIPGYVFPTPKKVVTVAKKKVVVVKAAPVVVPKKKVLIQIQLIILNYVKSILSIISRKN